jgi:ABC-type phosphate transport system auxiliary subunit
MDDLKRDFEAQLEELDKAMEKVSQNYKLVSNLHSEEINKLRSEKEEIQTERQKLQLETQRLQRIKAKNEEIQFNIKQGSQQNLLAMNPPSPTSSQGLIKQSSFKKKKASDFYFQKAQA